MSSADLAGLLPFVLLALVFYLLIIRPQRRRQAEVTKTQSELGVGTEVMLSSGIYGRVSSLDDETIQLEVSPGSHVKVARRAVVRVLDQEVAGPDPATDSLDEGPEPTDRHQ